jgi:hypothetical protein
MPQMSPRWLIAPIAPVLVVAVLAAEPRLELMSGAENDVAGVDPELVAFSEELENAQLRVNQRNAWKDHLITQLLEGRHSLDEVAAEFLQMNRESRLCMRAVRDNFPGATDEEKTARNVIAFTLARARSPEHKKELQTRLEREFEQRYGANRTTP